MEPPLVVQAAAVAVVGGTRYLGSLPELGCAPTPAWQPPGMPQASCPPSSEVPLVAAAPGRHAILSRQCSRALWELHVQSGNDFQLGQNRRCHFARSLNDGKTGFRDELI